VEPGVESGDAVRAAAETLKPPLSCAAGSIDAIATAPINKRALFLSGYSFPGHRVSGSPDQHRRFRDGLRRLNLRVVLISTHAVVRSDWFSQARTL
jgi:4-hydroxy-L-threonine phosphate dehydrogenase PdxA